MRPNRSVAFFALAGISACAASTPAVASSCNRVVAVRIEMAPGQACWTYRGAATTFVGDFSHGQTIAAQMIGEAADYDPRSGRAATVWRSRDPNVEGPGGFFFGGIEAPGVLTFRAPANGTYRFSFSPCALWGAPGAVKICAR
ncbi:MAG: hypothetical protein JO312_10060 [Hyphomicrobiales bacterium]|nr:hypothetical protein [Hyphomicrobiales bacterium]